MHWVLQYQVNLSFNPRGTVVKFRFPPPIPPNQRVLDEQRSAMKTNLTPSRIQPKIKNLHPHYLSLSLSLSPPPPFP
jgi:hypothetical protein